MYSKLTTGLIGKVGILLSFLTILVLASDAAAQCYCKNTRQRSARKRVTRTYRTPHAVRPARVVYRTPRSYAVLGESYTRTPGRYVAVVDDGRILYDADYYETARIASDYGYRDGWFDGRDAGYERDVYHPENSGDFQKATNGYEDDFGSKRLYKQAYKQAYLRGYKSGFRSVASRYTMRNFRNY